MWLRRGILQIDQPFHPFGLGDSSAENGPDRPTAARTPSYAEVRVVRAGRVAQVRDLLATVTPAELAEVRSNPHDSQYPETVRSCLHTLLEEEWEHHRFAVRDLDAISGGSNDGREKSMT